MTFLGFMPESQMYPMMGAIIAYVPPLMMNTKPTSTVESPNCKQVFLKIVFCYYVILHMGACPIIYVRVNMFFFFKFTF